LPGNQRAQLSLKGKDKQRSAFPLTLRDRQSILPSRASPPICLATGWELRQAGGLLIGVFCAPASWCG
jgi:hypothetical protein